MSDDLNYISYDEIDKFLPNDVATKVHEETKKIVDECCVVCKKLVSSHRDQIEQLANLLMEKDRQSLLRPKIPL